MADLYDGYDGFVLLEPREVFDSMILGVSTNAFIYDQDALIEYWAKEFTEDEVGKDEAYEMAVEWFQFNVEGAYMGEHTPVYCSKVDAEWREECLAPIVALDKALRHSHPSVGKG